MPEPLKYSGEWTFPDADSPLFGELQIDQEHKRIALTITIPHAEGQSWTAASYGRIPHICGTLNPLGTKMTLFDCITRHRQSTFALCTQAIISARYAFADCEIPSESDISFKTVKASFGDIVSWAQLSQFNLPSSNEDGFGFVCKTKPEVQLTIDRTLTITLSPALSSSGGNPFARELTLKQAVSAYFEYKEPVPWQQIERDLDCFASLLSFSMNEDVSVEGIRYQPLLSGDNHATEDNTLQPTMRDIFLGTGKSRNDGRNHYWQFAATLDDLNQVNAITRWYDQYDRLKPIINLYLIGIRGNAPSAETLFLNLTQALESFHARFIESRFPDFKGYENHVQDMVHGFGISEDSEQQWVDYLLTGATRHRIYLYDRIAYLIVDQGTRPFQSTICNIVPYTKKIVKTRNYFTHYSESNKDDSFAKEELPYVNSELMALLEYHILKVIGLSREFARKVIGKRLSGIKTAAYLAGMSFSQNKSAFDGKDAV